MIVVDIVADIVADILDGADGGTYGVPHGEPWARYIVGGHGTTWILRTGAEALGADTLTATVTAYVTAHSDALRSGARGVGFWRSNGRVWLDIVRVYSWLETAQTAARHNGEIAIWDSVARVEIATA